MTSDTIENTIAQAKKDWKAGNHKKAAEGFETAYNHFQQQNDEFNAAEMANNLCVAYLELGKKNKALEIVKGTEEIFNEHNDPQKEAIAIGNQASAQEALKQYDSAIDLYQKSADLFKEIGEDEKASYVLKSLSLLQLKQGKQLESIFAMERSLNSKDKLSIWQRIYRWLLRLPTKFLGN